MEFSHETALELVRSADQFPVDFDDAWKWAGYGERSDNEQYGRDAAIKALKANFDEGLDFSISKSKSTGGRPKTQIDLTVDCFKMFCMAAGTEQGKQVRRYFLECERELKRLKGLEAEPTSPPIAPSDPFDTLTHRQAAEILNQIKPICFAPVKGKAFAVGVVTNPVMAEFYETSLQTIRYLSGKHRETLEALGLEIAKTKTVNELKKIPQLKIPQMISVTTIWTPLAMLKFAELHPCPISDRVKALLTGQPTPVEVEVVPTPVAALPSSESRLAMLEKVLTLGEKLGGFDDRQKLMLRDELINTISVSPLALPPAGGKSEITISGRATELGHRLKSGQLMAAGKAAIAAYRNKYKAEPPKRDQFVDGAVRKVNVYYAPDDLPIVDAAIQAVAGGK
ncbi:hypothetical protein [Pantanalinema sp. GBBB05]|uniref:hypothetical protein n=1 Tax=Pantanalinema sp. GBBB05 TaxID=2604139 RepID=UPI003D81281F